MKRYLIFALILLAPLFALAQTFERDLRFGLQGDSDVIKLQEFLADRGLYSGPITGNFFSLTLKAVKKLQTQENIRPVSGYVGAKTREKLNQLFALELKDSDQQANTESVAPVSVSTAPTKTENNKLNVLSSVMEQVAALQKQLDLLLKKTPIPPAQTVTVPTQTPTTIFQPTPQSNISSQTTLMETLKISSVNVVPDMTSAKIEWVTNRPTESKLYLSGGGLTSKLFISETGYSTNHFSNISQLVPITDYSFQITAIGNSGLVSYTDDFKTKIPPPQSPTLDFAPRQSFNPESVTGVSLGTVGKLYWKSAYTTSCTASGAWIGEKPIVGEEVVAFSQVGRYTYVLTCIGNAGESVAKNVLISVRDPKPHIIFYFNDIPAETFSGKVGETVKLRWETSNTGGANNCTASNSWSGSKYIGGSQNILLETAGEFSYSLTCINASSGEGRTNTVAITVIQ
ncbi:MAG: peptidoglycan-binding domain-containing protein [bacterium]|nr:peptidoglycan-binding domain-containing protein [bacterium]